MNLLLMRELMVAKIKDFFTKEDGDVNIVAIVF